MRLVRSPGAVGLVRALELVELVDLAGQASRAGEETKDRRYLSDVVRDNVEVYDLIAFCCIPVVSNTISNKTNPNFTSHMLYMEESKTT